MKGRFFSISICLPLICVVSLMHAQQIAPAVQQGHYSDIVKLAVAPSGKTLVSYGSDKQIAVWDLRTGMQLKRIKWETDPKTIVFVNDSVIQLASYTKITTLINLASGRSTEENQANAITAVSSNIQIAGPLLQITENGMVKKSFTTQYFDKGFTSYATHPGSNYLFASALDGWIYVYDLKALKLVKTLREHRAAVHDVIISADGTCLYSAGGDRSIIEWDIKTLKLKRRLFAHSYRMTAVSFSPSGETLYFGNELGEIKSLQLTSLSEGLKVIRISDHPVQQIIPQKHKDNLLVTSLENRLYTVTTQLDKKKNSGKYHRIGIRQAIRGVIRKGMRAYLEPAYNKFLLAQNENTIVYYADEKKNKHRRKLVVKNLKTGKRHTLRSSTAPVSDLTLINDSLIAVRRGQMNTPFSQLNACLEIWKIKGRKVYNAELSEPGIRGLASWDNKFLMILKAGEIALHDIRTNTVKHISLPNSSVGENIWIRDSLCLVADAANQVLVYRFNAAASLELLCTLSGHEGAITDATLKNDKNTLVTASEDATIRFWDLKKKELTATLIVVDKNDFIFLLPNGNYQITKKAYKMFGFSSGLDFYFPDQFDLKFNRPHEVVDALNSADREKIAALKKAYEKRLKRMGFTESSLAADLTLPSVKITQMNAKEENTCQLTLEIADAATELDRINVYVNNVPVFGSNGISLADKKVLNWNGEITVPLLEGNNKIEASALNKKGIESFRTSVIVKGNKSDKPVLHLISIGISDYQNNSYDLAYPSKDAKDLPKTFTSFSSGVYSDVRTLTITDSLATAAGIEKQCREFLSSAKANDVVMVFIAGHGVLDKDLNYYLAMHDMDFTDPVGKGLPYEKLEGITDGIWPLRKAIFIDACHSGELDKEEVEQLAIKNSVTSVGNIKFRTAGSAIQKKNLGLQSTSELMNELFTDIRRGCGATVVSSAGGAEYAMESDEWKNGLFTYCLINGLKNKKADLNKDGIIMLSELQKYLQLRVLELSGGQQKPTSRTENLALDFRVW